MKTFIIKNKYLLIILFISLIIYFRWLSFDIFSSSDYYFSFKESLRNDIFSSYWYVNWDMGIVNILLWKILFNFLFGFFSIFGFNSNISDKIVLFWPWIIFSGFFSFLLVREITNSNIGALIGSFVFCYNTYFLTINSAGHEFISLASVFLVLTVWLFTKTIKEKKIYLAVLTALVLFLVGSYDIRILYINIWVLFFYTLYYIFIINEKYSLKKILTNFILPTFMIFLLILLNFFWLFPSIKFGTLLENEVLSRTLFGSNFFDIAKSLTLFHPFWNGAKIEWFLVQQIPIYFWVIPIFAFLGLLLNYNNKKILFFGFLSLLGILLTKQASDPFSGLYPWLFNNFPGFTAFREASKFYILIILGYSVLIGAFIAWIWENWKKTKWQIYLKYLLTIIVSLIFLLNAKPILTGKIGTMYVQREVPQDYLIFRKFISNQPDYFRTLWVPKDSRWSFYNNNHPKINSINITESKWKELFNPFQYNLYPIISDEIISIFQETVSSRLISDFNIKYIIVPIQDRENDDDFFINYGGDRQFYINKLDKVKYLTKINIGTKDLVVYENKDYRPHVYRTDEKESLYKDISINTVNYQSINPNEYRVSINKVNKPIYLHLSEDYNLNWEIRIGKFNWFKGLFIKNYFLPEKYHFENDAKLNSFLIDPKYVKDHYPKESYKENSDGSYDINLTIYMKPQSYLYFGFIISGATLASCLGYILYSLLKRRKNEKKF